MKALKIIGAGIFVIGIFITISGILIEKQVAFSDVAKTNNRITWIGWGTVTSLVGIGLILISTIDQK